MLDDLRQQADDDFFVEEEQELFPDEKLAESRSYFLGMTPVQRFVISVMLLMMTCIIGSFLLLVTNKVIPPFLF